MNLNKIIAVILFSSVFSTIAHAAIPGSYVGGGVGLSRLEDFSDATNTSKRGVTGTVFAGYNFNEYWGLEASYRKYAKAVYQDDVYNLLTNYNLRAISFVGKFYAPMGSKQQVNLYTLLGASHVQGKGNVVVNQNTIISDTNDAIVGTVGLGISYDIASKVTAAFEFTHTAGKSGNNRHLGIPQSNMATVNLSYHVG